MKIEHIAEMYGMKLTVQEVYGLVTSSVPHITEMHSDLVSNDDFQLLHNKKPILECLAHIGWIISTWADSPCREPASTDRQLLVALDGPIYFIRYR